MLPNLIPIGVIMVHFSTYARPCVHPMTCASQMGEACARYVIRNFLQRDNTKCIFIRACRSSRKFNETLRLNRYGKPLSPVFLYRESVVINQEQNLFSRNHLLYFHYVIKELVHAFSCAYIELWMHLGCLESTQEAKITLLSCSPNFPRASIT